VLETESGEHMSAEVAQESGMGPDTHASTNEIHNEDISQPDTLVCSICTEDFTKGEDVRVLPCNHKFHPACVDPWLLNVSGTCPLCRVNLNPAPEQLAASEGETELPPPLAHDGEIETGENMDSEAMRIMPADERLAALQEAARTRRAQAPYAETDAETRRHRTRLASRLRDTFRIHTRRSDGASEGTDPTSAPLPGLGSTGSG